MRRLALLGLAAVLVACQPAAAPVGSGQANAPSSTPTMHTLQGGLELNSTSVLIGTVSGCNGTDGYDDIHEGSQVVVTNESGTVIGTTELGPGRSQSSGVGCRYDFSVAVPDAAFYNIAVGDRGKLTYSKAELESRSWGVVMTLGSD